MQKTRRQYLIRMTYEEYNDFCGEMPGTSHVVQWGGAHVWKVGGKVFAIGGWNESDQVAITFKTSDLAFEILKDMPGLRPAPYLASRGFKWIQNFDRPGLSDDDLRDYIAQSYQLVASGLTKKIQRQLGLLEDR